MGRTTRKAAKVDGYSQPLTSEEKEDRVRLRALAEDLNRFVAKGFAISSETRDAIASTLDSELDGHWDDLIESIYKKGGIVSIEDAYSTKVDESVMPRNEVDYLLCLFSDTLLARILPRRLPEKAGFVVALTPAGEAVAKVSLGTSGPP